MNYDEKLALLESLRFEVAGKPQVLGSWEAATTFCQSTRDDFKPDPDAPKVEAPPIEISNEEAKRLFPHSGLWIAKGTHIGRAGIPDYFVAQMYRSYTKGMSLEAVGRRYGRTRQSIYELFARRKLPMRPDSRRRKKVEMTYKGVEYSPAKTGYLRATAGDRKFLHWVIWEEHHGPVPNRSQIFFRDGNSRNFDISNLGCETRAEGLTRVRNGENHFLKARRLAIRAGNWSPSFLKTYDVSFFNWFKRHGLAIAKAANGYAVSSRDNAVCKYKVCAMMIERLVANNCLAAQGNDRWIVAALSVEKAA